MAAAHSHFDRPLGLQLSAHVGKIFARRLLCFLLEQLPGVVRRGLQGKLTPQKLDGFTEAAHAIHFEAFHKGGLRGVCSG